MSKCPIKQCECGHTEFVYHRDKRWWKHNHWHCRKCRKQYDEASEPEDEPSIADQETWMKL